MRGRRGVVAQECDCKHLNCVRILIQENKLFNREKVKFYDSTCRDSKKWQIEFLHIYCIKRHIRVLWFGVAYTGIRMLFKIWTHAIFLSYYYSTMRSFVKFFFQVLCGILPIADRGPGEPSVITFVIYCLRELDTLHNN